MIHSIQVCEIFHQKVPTPSFELVSYLSSGSSLGAPTELIISNVVSDGVRLGQEDSIRSLKGWNLSQGELLEKFRGLVGLSELEVLGQAQLGSAVLGSDERLLSTEVVGVGIQRLGEIGGVSIWYYITVGTGRF